jgi:hypothetical protein
MIRDLIEASQDFAGKHGIGEIALEPTVEYKSMMRTAFDAGALRASAPALPVRASSVDTTPSLR